MIIFAKQLIESAVGIPATLVSSCLLAEFFGYWIHRLLHSEAVPFLSRGHLIHHFRIYGPLQPMRTDIYKDATDDRVSVGNVGAEWLVPAAIVLGLCWGTMALLGVPGLYQAIVLGTLAIWPILTFNYIHDRMHLADFWMSRNPLLKNWFLKARRLHDIHHHGLDDQGRMDTNFGIGFYLFDRCFRTLAKRHGPLNWTGYRAAEKRYGLEGQTDNANEPDGLRFETGLAGTLEIQQKGRLS
jgi:sterol desaturase/sphingolipid hydroxylase (fatty acid hydroxylase superfamily)